MLACETGSEGGELLFKLRAWPGTRRRLQPVVDFGEANSFVGFFYCALLQMLYHFINPCLISFEADPMMSH